MSAEPRIIAEGHQVLAGAPIDVSVRDGWIVSAWRWETKGVDVALVEAWAEQMRETPWWERW